LSVNSYLEYTMQNSSQTIDLVRVDPSLQNLYDGYFETTVFETQKNQLAARDSVDAMLGLAKANLGTLVDVGAGDGFVSRELIERKAASKVTALEISESGMKKIYDLQLDIDVVCFDGYSIPFPDKKFDYAVCSHVVEHVEHERLFLREIGRVAKSCLFVVPLEGGMRGRVYRGMGHINYFTPMTFRNLIETSGFRLINESVFPCSFNYECHLKGTFRGTLSGAMRRILRKTVGQSATNFMTYLMAIHCESSS
jgi:SAM-dependent methyltransferase